MKKIRILIADDHAVVRAGLASILRFAKDIQIVGSAANGLEAVAKTGELKPDVVIMDLMMPVLNGVDASARIAELHPESKILILTTYGSSEDIRRALDAGAVGAIMKTVSNQMLVAAIRKTAAGTCVLSPEIEQALNESLATDELTPRQLEVLGYVTRGFTNEDIAKHFGITYSAVKQHLSNVFTKLGAANRSEAVSIALRKQLVKM